METPSKMQSNNYTSCFYETPPAVQTMVKYFFYTSVFLFSTVGNVLVCFVVWRRQRLQNVMNYFLVNLATADLTFTVICIPFDLYVQGSGYNWPFGSVLCKMLYPLQTMTLYASVFTLCAISFSRYRAIVRPMKKQLTIRESKYVIACIWLTSLVMVVPYIVVLQVDAECQFCIEKWQEPAAVYRKVYTFFIFVSQYLMPLSILFFAYLRVWRDLRWKRREPSGPNHTRENAKVLKMVIVLTLFFAACLLPNHIVYLVLDFNHDGNYIIHSDWIIASNFMILLNSALDPLLYTMFNEKYRLEFKRIFLCKNCCQTQSK